MQLAHFFFYLNAKISDLKEVQEKKLELDTLKGDMYDLKELGEYTNVLAKIIEVRSKKRQANVSDSFFKLKSLIDVIEQRKQSYQSKKNSIKGFFVCFQFKVFLLEFQFYCFTIWIEELLKNNENSSLNNIEENFSKNLKLMERDIKKTLFGCKFTFKNMHTP